MSAEENAASSAEGGINGELDQWLNDNITNSNNNNNSRDGIGLTAALEPTPFRSSAAVIDNTDVDNQGSNTVGVVVGLESHNLTGGKTNNQKERDEALDDDTVEIEPPSNSEKEKNDTSAGLSSVSSADGVIDLLGDDSDDAAVVQQSPKVSGGGGPTMKINHLVHNPPAEAAAHQPQQAMQKQKQPSNIENGGDDDDDDDDSLIIEPLPFKHVPTAKPSQVSAAIAAAENAAKKAAEKSYKYRSSNMPSWMDLNSNKANNFRHQKSNTAAPTVAATSVTSASFMSPTTSHTASTSTTPTTGRQIQKMYHSNHATTTNNPLPSAAPATHQNTMIPNQSYNTPTYIDASFGTGYIPTWSFPLPPTNPVLIPQSTSSIASSQKRAYKLSLVSVSEFTVTATTPSCFSYDTSRAPPPSLSGLRRHIKKITRDAGAGAAIYDKEKGSTTEGRWRIPIGAYHAFHTFLRSDPCNEVECIPDYQLRLASLGRARLDRSYPSSRRLMRKGVPMGLAKALAPYQRGGVDFILEKNGKALLADEMGLGKTVQGIAAMTCYEAEWPLLVVCPSSARYHWEQEFLHWLGAQSIVNKKKKEDEVLETPCDSDSEDSTSKKSSKKEKSDLVNTSSEESGSDSESENKHQRRKSPMRLLRKFHINVLSSSKDKLFPPCSMIRVVICSYGLITGLINKSKKIQPGTFKCILVDESHMLKSKSTQRTKAMLPVMKAATRCVLLSGTPALSRPKELWPQLSVLGNWWVDERNFIEKYCRPSRGRPSSVVRDGEDENDGDGENRAELHTLLTSTVMIRRVKADMLKSLPHKIRDLAYVKLQDEGSKYKFNKYMALLRKGRGALGKLARTHHEENGNEESSPSDKNDSYPTITVAQALHKINLESEEQHRSGMDQIQRKLIGNTRLDERSLQSHMHAMQDVLARRINEHKEKRKLEVLAGNGYFDGKKIVNDSSLNDELVNEDNEEITRKAVLNQLYNMTGTEKVPCVVEKLNQWLDDPTKGKLCIFAHHISVLDSIQSGAGLSNAKGSKTKFIRIDGATMPKTRQESIVSFQNDPTIRVALLGITAAGVAVTLTASSNVWFAELFWTPAIMIQAEDRCHRIGQQTNVRCVYFIARGTLDEVLWRLIEQKFRALGEFVEGKEKQKIVVHNSYNWDEKENDATVSAPDEEVSSEAGKKRPRSESFADIVDTDEIQNDIAELCKEEEEMLKKADNNDDDDDNETVSRNGSGSSSKKQKEQVKPIGLSNTSAICLSGDEEEDEDNQATPQPQHHNLKDAINHIDKAKMRDMRFNPLMTLPELKLYKMHFPGPSYGLYMSYYQGRVIVRKKHQKRVQEYGADVKPDVGSILIAINGYSIPQKMQFQQILALMKNVIGNPPVELIFGEDEDFIQFCTKVVLPSLEKESSKEGEVAMDHLSGRQGRNIPGNTTSSNYNPMPQSISTLQNTQVLPGSTGTGSQHDAIELLDDE